MSADALTLTDFLLVRIAEDVAAAPNADISGWGMPDAVVARLIAEHEAKRQIVERLSAWESVEPRTSEVVGAINALRSVAKILANIYADHPDYLEEWKP